MYTDLSYFGNVSLETVTMANNSQQPTLLCVITFYVFLPSLYDQYVPFLEFVVSSAVVILAPTQAALDMGVNRTRQLATEPPQHTQPMGGPMAEFLQGPRDDYPSRNFHW